MRQGIRISNLHPPSDDYPVTKRHLDIASAGSRAAAAIRLINERGFDLTLHDPMAQRYHDWFRARRAWFTDPLDWEILFTLQIYAPRPSGLGPENLRDYVREHFGDKKRAAVESWYVRRALVDSAYGTIDLDTALEHFTATVVERSRQFNAMLEEGP